MKDELFRLETHAHWHSQYAVASLKTTIKYLSWREKLLGEDDDQWLSEAKDVLESLEKLDRKIYSVYYKKLENLGK